MIERILPVTKNKLEILRFIFESGSTHLLEISKKTQGHPYSLQRTIKSLDFIEKTQVGRTIVLRINRSDREYVELACMIEDYRLGSACASSKTIRLLAGNLQRFLAKDADVLSCALFGSYARGAEKGHDVDLLFVVNSKKKREKGLLAMCRQLSVLLGLEVNPVIMDEREFRTSVGAGEPAIKTILEPSQRLIISGREYFIRNTMIAARSSP